MIKNSKETQQAQQDSFDILSSERFVDTIVENEPAAKVEEKVDAGDDSANEFLADVKKQEKAAVKVEDKSSADEEVAADELDVENKDDKKVDTKDKKPETKLDGAKADVAANKTAAENKEGDNPDDKKEETELSFDEDHGTTAPNISKEGEEETKWTDVAKELGIEVKEDSFEAFKEAVEKKAEISIGKFKPESQRAIKFMEAGGTMDDFIEPFAKVDQVLALSDADLALKQFVTEKWSEEKALAKIEAMAEEGSLDPFVAKIRESLTNYRNEVKDNIIDQRIKAQDLYEQKIANAFKEEAKQINAALVVKKEFMGTPLKDINREKISKKYENGEYEEALKDPAFIADFLLYKEYGEKAVANLKEKLTRELKITHKNTVHNVPPKSGKAGAVQRTPSGHDSDTFSILEEERM